jgi:hypothetical protein
MSGVGVGILNEGDERNGDVWRGCDLLLSLLIISGSFDTPASCLWQIDGLEATVLE